jgi:glycosyltransferase involved in cell wall biosynthesis
MISGQQLKTAVMVPCFNEELTIGKVVDDFRRWLPAAVIYVFDNCSTDLTAATAAEHGAVVIKEPRKGKGFVVESMFNKIDADIYVMVDGDNTYPAEKVKELIAPLVNGQADMVVGARFSNYEDNSFRPMGILGNNLVRALVNWVSGSRLTDIMSGYRTFNRRVVETIPVVSAGFEVETEITIQALYHKLKIIEVQIPYRPRPEGSKSKLEVIPDGIRVLWKIFSLFRSYKPLTFFGAAALVLLALALFMGWAPINDYLTGPGHYVRHVKLAIVAGALAMLSLGCFFLGILLHAINWRFKELHNVLTRKHSM